MYSHLSVNAPIRIFFSDMGSQAEQEVFNSSFGQQPEDESPATPPRLSKTDVDNSRRFDDLDSQIKSLVGLFNNLHPDVPVSPEMLQDGVTPVGVKNQRVGSRKSGYAGPRVAPTRAPRFRNNNGRRYNDRDLKLDCLIKSYHDTQDQIFALVQRHEAFQSVVTEGLKNVRAEVIPLTLIFHLLSFHFITFQVSAAAGIAESPCFARAQSGGLKPIFLQEQTPAVRCSVTVLFTGSKRELRPDPVLKIIEQASHEIDQYVRKRLHSYWRSHRHEQPSTAANFPAYLEALGIANNHHYHEVAEKLY